MNIEEFNKIFKNFTELMVLNIDEEQKTLLYTFMKDVLEKNKEINLTAIKDEKDFIIKHIIDSLTIQKYINKQARVIDIGTGAGFPGIPLKIVRPDIEIVLVDSLNKRVNFINEEIVKLKLKKIEAIHSRAEELGNMEKYRENFDYAVSRAVADTKILAEYTIPLVKIKGKIIFMKGANIEEELQGANKAIKILGGKIKQTDEIYLTKGDNKRNIVIIEKIDDTPKKYPRKPGMAKKEPIQ